MHFAEYPCYLLQIESDVDQDFSWAQIVYCIIHVAIRELVIFILLCAEQVTYSQAYFVSLLAVGDAGI